jgi:methylmalonyl-CoA mutase C-terminal domain/subunit|tara:strand:- start:29 stop:331 length:303 start_codon:yes stop_codon:yes gene_type:complete
MEVVYTGPWQEIPAVVNMAMEEDVDVIGISSLATDHLIVPKLMAALSEAKLNDVAVVVGGIVPDDEERALYESGVAHVFHPGTKREEIVEVLESLVAARR